MDIVQMRDSAKRDLNIAVAVMSIIPILGFVYLIVGRISSLSVLEGDVGYAMLVLLLLALLGIVSGRKIVWYMIAKIIDMNKELIEKEKLATVSETFISLSHEIRNPLAMIIGNLDLMTGKAAKETALNIISDQTSAIRANCNRIAEIMDKMSRISKPSFTTYGGGIKMLDLPSCELGDNRKK